MKCAHVIHPVLALCCLSISGLNPLRVAAADFRPLQNFPGISEIHLQSISGNGDYLVGSANYDPDGNGTGELTGILWNRQGEAQLLGTNFIPVKVSNSGDFVVGTQYSSSELPHSTQWTPSGGIAPIEGFKSDSRDWHVTDMSSDGSVIVGTLRDLATGSRDLDAFRWTQHRGFELAGYDGGEACGTIIDVVVSRNGVHAGFSDFADCVGIGHGAAHYWRGNGDFELIRSVSGAIVSLRGISDDGNTAVGYGLGGFIIERGQPPIIGRPSLSFAAVSADGNTVVGTFNSSLETEARIQIEAEYFGSMSDFLEDRHGLASSLSGW